MAVDVELDPQRLLGRLPPAAGQAALLRGEEMAQATAAPFLGQFPIDPELAKLCDEGKIERYESEPLNNFSKSFLREISAGAK